MAMNRRHSKIVCTLGPATNSPRMIRRLIEAGMDVARLNFSNNSIRGSCCGFDPGLEQAATRQSDIIRK